MALFKNKETDKKRKGENVIGKIIYGFLLFAPLMSILFTSLYTVFNKNAYQSYYGDTINNEIYNEVTDISSLNNGDKIILTNLIYNNTSGNVLGSTTEGFLIQVDEVLQNSTTLQIENTIRLCYVSSGPTNTSRFYDENNLIGYSPETFKIKCTYLGNNLSLQELNEYKTLLNNNTTLQKITYNNYSYLDNAFEYGMYKTEESNIYNWSKTTGTYTVLQNVCTGIGITNTFVPMLMTYWLLISIIYFLFDIALILIWAVHDKIHALKDAI